MIEVDETWNFSTAKVILLFDIAQLRLDPITPWY